MTAQYNAEAIQSVVGAEFKVVAARNGNFRLDLARLVNKTDVPRDDEKFTLLADARQALRDAGYPAEVQLSTRDQQGNRIAWPCIWINKTQSTNTEVNELKAQVAQLTGMMAQLMTKLAGDARPAEQTVDDDGDSTPSPTHNGPPTF